MQLAVTAAGVELSVIYRNIVAALCNKLRETNQEVLRSILRV